MKKIAIYSHCALDTISIAGNSYEQIGGAACYCGLMARELKFDVDLFTKYGADFPKQYLNDNKINLTNPDLIVIGDEYALFGDRFLDEIKAQIEKRLLPSVFSSVDVKLSVVTQDTVLAGTFLDVFSQTYLGVTREIYHTLPTESV